MPIRSLDAAFTARDGAPTIARVDTTIFTRHYFTHCLQCDFCQDWCCQHGVDVDQVHYDAIMRHAPELEGYTGIPRTEWFTGEVEEDPDVPGGRSHRTRVNGHRCVFHRQGERGCTIHAFCLEHSLDYHALKSMVDCLFPITFYDDVLCASDEVNDGTLVCGDTGPSLYRGLRHELRYYFGEPFVAVLDTVEARVLS